MGYGTEVLYDCGSARAKKTIQTASGTTSYYYIGEHFEVKTGVETAYVFPGNLRVAQISVDSGTTE